MASIQVVAASKEEAIDKALEPDNYPDWASARNTLEAKPIKPYDDRPVRATVGEPRPAGSVGQSTPVPGSTQDLQQQRSQGRFTGSWKVMVGGEEVYRFGGVGNNQADANRVARAWIEDQVRRGTLSLGDAQDIEVLPIMD